MKNGYKILWTDNALKVLEKTIKYLQENWTEKELRNLALKLEEIVTLVSQNPNIFQVSDIKKEIRRVVILSHNTLYYRIVANQIEIISFFFQSSKSKKTEIKINRL
jgi:plasmid stabilization system protein ParE